jgi:hypothetical protein
MIHGGCATIGCIPIENQPIEQLFNIVRDSRRKYRRWATLHIFPARMNDQGMRLLRRLARARPELLDFWLQLHEGFMPFEKNGTHPSHPHRLRRAPSGPEITRVNGANLQFSPDIGSATCQWATGPSLRQSVHRSRSNEPDFNTLQWSSPV